MFFPGDDHKNEGGEWHCTYGKRGFADIHLGTDCPESADDKAKKAVATGMASQSGVRFANDVQEIDPVSNISEMARDSSTNPRPVDDLTPEAKEEIRNLAMTLQKSRLQESRMSNFRILNLFSLPPSRVSQSQPLYHDSRPTGLSDPAESFT